MSKRWRAAILGAGIGGQHMEGYRALPDLFQVTTICDLDPQRARSIAGPDATVVTDLAAVLTDTNIDLVDICLPPHLHVPVALRALDAGKHVICEKPIATSLEEADRLHAVISRTGQHYFPVFQYRFGPGLAQLRALLASGLAGTPLVASAEVHWQRGSDYYAIPWRGTWDGEQGGALLSHAIHAHDLLCHILGPVTQVHALTDTRANPIETEDCAAISFRMASGALATSSVTLGAAGNMSRFRFCFSGLTAESGRNPYHPADDTWNFTATDPTQQPEVDAIIASTGRQASGFEGYLAAVAQTLDGTPRDAVTFADGYASIELVSALYASAERREGVTLPLPPDEPVRKGWRPET